jgi:LmbE family N-acetylglucosaminyl deacetylase
MTRAQTMRTLRTDGAEPARADQPAPCDVLVVIAHPDDELFVSGTLCHCAHRGFSIALVCLTNGEGARRERAPDAALGELRTRELLRSAAALGARQVTLLEQADVADPARDARARWDEEVVTSALAGLIARTRPALILTHGPRGGYGHAAHRATHRCVMAAARQVGYARSIFSFCGRVPRAFFSWHFDQPSHVRIDARRYLRRRAAALSCHRSQADQLLQPRFPATPRKWLSALAGYLLAATEFGRKRIPIVTPSRFFRRFPVEGLVLHQAPDAERPHFFREHFQDDRRVQIVG